MFEKHNLISGIHQLLRFFFFFSTGHRADSTRKVSAKSNVCLCLKLHSKQTSIQVIKMCRRFMFIVHFLFYACSLLFSQFSTSNINRQQSHYSDGSNLNFGCIDFNFLQRKHLSYTHSFIEDLFIFLQTPLAII